MGMTRPMLLRLTVVALACLPALPVLTSASSASGEPVQVSNASACYAIAKFLPPLGTRLDDKRIADIIATKPHSVLLMHTTTSFSLSLESRYVGSARCQRNTLYRATSGGREEIAMPEYFAGGEGALCAGDRVQLAAVSGIPALLEEDPSEDRTVISLTLLKKMPGGHHRVG